MELGAGRNETLQREWVRRVVLGLHPSVTHIGRGTDDRLISLWQAVPLFEIDEVVEHRAAFPPAGIVIVLGDLVEAELLVIVGPDPLDGIERALFERRINVTAGEL